MWEVSVVRSLKTYQLAATLVFIKTLASCVIGSDKEIFTGMTRGLRWADVTAHPLKGLVSRPCTVLPPPHTSLWLQQLLLLLSAVHFSGSWHEALAPGDYSSPLPFPLSSQPSAPLSPFLPPWSCPSCFITTVLPLHKQSTDSEVTSAAERLLQTLPRSLSQPYRNPAEAGGYIISRLRQLELHFSSCFGLFHWTGLLSVRITMVTDVQMFHKMPVMFMALCLCRSPPPTLFVIERT